jgi:hypothetical protein
MVKLYLIERLREQCFVDVIFDTVILNASFKRVPENDKPFWPLSPPGLESAPITSVH